MPDPRPLERRRAPAPARRHRGPSEFRTIDVAEGYAYEATTKRRRYPELGSELSIPINMRTAWFHREQRQLRAHWLQAAPRR